MKTSIQVRNGVSSQMVDLVVRLVDLIPWPIRRTAMGDVTTSLLDGKPRVAEDVFGWNRATVELGMNEFLQKRYMMPFWRRDGQKRHYRQHKQFPTFWIAIIIDFVPWPRQRFKKKDRNRRHF